MSSADERPREPRILCTGIIVLDEVFRVKEFPKPDGKTQTNEFFVVNGGCAANAAVAIARLGGHVALTGPLGGPAGEDSNGDRVLAALTRENVDCSRCVRLPGMSTALSAIFIDARGDRMIVTYRDERVATAKPDNPDDLVAAADMVMADNRYPDFVHPICEAGRRRGLTVIVDGDRPTVEDDPLFAIASHVIFSAECLRETTSLSDLGEGLLRIARHTKAFLAVSDGPSDIVYLDAGAVRRLPVFSVQAVDTLGAGDALHGGFALAIAEGKSKIEAMRYGAAVAAIKCTRIGGSAGAPTRGELEEFLANHAAKKNQSPIDPKP